MPVFFECVLKCDAPGCGRMQQGRALLQPLNIATLAILGSDSHSEPFDLEFDPSNGLRWTVAFGRAACCEACRVVVEALFNTPAFPT